MSIKVSGCYIYPLKSGAGMPVDKFVLTERGPTHDRLWMLVQDQGINAGKFITQRDRGCEKLSLVQSSLDKEGKIKFSTPAGKTLEVSQSGWNKYKGAVRVWSDECAAVDAGDTAAKWFSDYLGQPCRLVKIPDDFIRATDPAYSRQGDQVSFADGFPLLVTNMASLKTLSEHFPPNVEIGMERFRPNIVLEGAEPFEEDVIHELKIGNVVLEFVKPCSRCKITTIDQTEGVSPSNEPLKTMGQVRRGKGDGLQGVFFGQNAVARVLGTINVGDEVEILSKRSLHPALENAVLKAEVS
ncbi:MAG: MOSC domain-containing protein [Alphaproteobacteria bacterium]